jgi:WD40 repeat protein
MPPSRQTGAFSSRLARDATVRIWDLEALQVEVYQLDGVRDVFQGSPDGRLALTVDPATGTAALVTADAFEVRHHLDFKPDPILDGSTARSPFSSDGQLVTGINELGRILVYDVASGEQIAAHANPDGVYKHPTFVPGGRLIFAGGNRGAYLLDAEGGQHVQVLDVPGTDISNRYSDLVAVSDDGRYGAMHVQTESPRNLVYVWDLETGNLEFQSASNPDDFIVAFAFSADSRYFAWGGTENIVYVLDLHSREEVIQLSHLDSIHEIDLSADNRLLLVSTGGDGVILWDLESGEIVRRFFAGSGQTGFARFDMDDSFVLYATMEDGLIHRQPLSPEKLIESMCAGLQRDLTAVERRTYGLDDSPTCPKFAAGS